ncbi:hypothetical protein KEM55_001825 [Ascosphaera atra]|nr:hypothetical protein KEM55_001825 [Ascosphaera atra]
MRDTNILRSIYIFFNKRKVQNKPAQVKAAPIMSRHLPMPFPRDPFDGDIVYDYDDRDDYDDLPYLLAWAATKFMRGLRNNGGFKSMDDIGDWLASANRLRQRMADYGSNGTYWEETPYIYPDGAGGRQRIRGRDLYFDGDYGGRGKVRSGRGNAENRALRRYLAEQQEQLDELRDQLMELQSKTCSGNAKTLEYYFKRLCDFIDSRDDKEFSMKPSETVSSMPREGSVIGGASSKSSGRPRCPECGTQAKGKDLYICMNCGCLP